MAVMSGRLSHIANQIQRQLVYRQPHFRPSASAAWLPAREIGIPADGRVCYGPISTDFGRLEAPVPYLVAQRRWGNPKFISGLGQRHAG
jgi:hypothetical protein